MATTIIRSTVRERDYIHVVDLAKGRVAELGNLTSGVHIYNLGTGKRTYVLEMIRTFERFNEVKVTYKVVPRRSRYIAICYADVSKAKHELNLKATLRIEDSCRDIWVFEKNKRNVIFV